MRLKVRIKSFLTGKRQIRKPERPLVPDGNQKAQRLARKKQRRK